MKTGIRTPSIEKKIKAKTTGKVKRKLKRTVNPLYGQKGMGYVKNPEKAIKNSIYHKTTIDAYSLIQPTETKNVISKRNNNTTTTNAVTGLLLAIFLGWAGGYRFYKKQYLLGFFYFFTVGICGIGWIIDLFCAYGAFYDERHAPSYLKLDKSKYMDPKPEFFPNYANEQFYIIYDFETTGLDPHKCEIIEIGAIKIADGNLVSPAYTVLYLICCSTKQN